ncbi:12000_t:CDS:2, partial [Entrophospora sp. SA101]
HRGLECRRQFCEPVGAWFSQLGFLNCVHHMWQYPDLENRKITREKAWEVDGWAETVYKTVRLVQKMEANILKPLDFSPLR